MNKIYEFVKESNAIEGIHRAPTKKEIKAHEDFLALEHIEVADLEEFVKKVAAAPLRRDPYLPNITIGGHYPPSNGPLIEKKLTDLLKQVNSDIGDEYYSYPFQTHIEYELLHPFMDGNGRSGRVLWAWMMKKDGLDPFILSFKHYWYYQSLDAARYS